MRCPPGTEIYRRDTLSVFEVRGDIAGDYCSNLGMFARLFSHQESLYGSTVQQFTYYLLCTSDVCGSRLLGFFTKVSSARWRLHELINVIVIYLPTKYRNKNMKIVNNNRVQQGRNCAYSCPHKVIRSVAARFGLNGMPRPPLMTRVQLFFWIKRRRRWDRRCELMTLTFDLGGHRDCRSYASWYFVRVPSANFGDTTTIRYRFMGHWANMVQTDHVTLRPWPLTLEVMVLVADAGRHPPSVYQVWSS